VINKDDVEIVVMVTGWVFLAVVVTYVIMFFRLTSWIRGGGKEGENLGNFNFIGARKRVLTATQIMIPSRLPRFIFLAKRKELYKLRILLISAIFLFIIIIILGVIQEGLSV